MGTDLLGADAYRNRAGSEPAKPATTSSSAAWRASSRALRSKAPARQWRCSRGAPPKLLPRYSQGRHDGADPRSHLAAWPDDSAHALDSARGGAAFTAHWLRERREPPARTRCRAPSRTRTACRARCEPVAPCAPHARRERGVLHHGRSSRVAARGVDGTPWWCSLRRVACRA